MLTPDDVRNVVFARAWRRERGYDESEVDAFLNRVVATLSGKRLLTARDVLTVEFSPRKRGARAYKKTQVDAFLDQIALTLMKREVRASRTAGAQERRAEPEPRIVRRVEKSAEPVQAKPVEPESVDLVPRGGFDQAGPQQPALDKAEVDAFVDRVAATLRGADTLTAQDLLTARFNPPKPGHPGYQEASVVAFLVMASTSIKHLAPRERAIPAQRMPIAKAFGRMRGGPKLTAEAVGSVVFSEAPAGEHGYAVSEVDDLLDRVVAALRGAAALSAAEVRDAEFTAVEAGGYDPEEVDSLLDLVAEHLDTAPAPNRA
ncbi:DivIVA domain-containing protein [Saccharopolyspora antimicrobica]|uniref:Cell wall synthesis protein Wag31 n=1 Tax=Saccharopolyspora antimicrobica TaxID=455193 RepID=A0A1I4TR66_9PSEU|nr:DivIVA domain-containing protein [Saccharopolyspora antimicrobica]RKT88517.1 DivIVA domain-containing protein [Saccharopolyspora antimicrobica]SFM79189.1 DivIVA domain-containing protein [Saccharopolyspora antimicrobica]